MSAFFSPFIHRALALVFLCASFFLFAMRAEAQVAPATTSPAGEQQPELGLGLDITGSVSGTSGCVAAGYAANSAAIGAGAAAAAPGAGAAVASAALSVPVIDVGLNTSVSTNVAINSTLTAKETILDVIAYCAASTALEMIANEIANKILSSYNAIVRDLNKELSDLVNRVEDQIGIDIGFSNTCFPELPLYKNSQYNGLKFRIDIACTLGTPEQARKFSSDFSDGGWSAYRAAVFEPQNNPFGSYIMVQNELNRRSEREVEREKQELAWGRGVRALRDKITGRFIKEPAAAIQAKLDAAFGLQLNRSGQADEISEIVGTFTSLLVSRALSDGVF